MKARNQFIGSAAWALTMLLLGFHAVARMPADAVLPIHWNATGLVDAQLDARTAIWIMPVMALMVSVVMAVLPALTRVGDGLTRSETLYRIAWAGVLCVLGVAHAMIIGPAFGWHLSVAGIPAVLGLLFIAIGNVLPKSRPNRFVGIRTAWTLASTDNWIATHRFAGKLFILAGAMMVAGALLPLTPAVRLILVLAPILITVILPITYSWRLSVRQSVNGDN